MSTVAFAFVLLLSIGYALEHTHRSIFNCKPKIHPVCCLIEIKLSITLGIHTNIQIQQANIV